MVKNRYYRVGAINIGYLVTRSIYMYRLESVCQDWREGDCYAMGSRIWSLTLLVLSLLECMRSDEVLINQRCSQPDFPAGRPRRKWGESAVASFD